MDRTILKKIAVVCGVYILAAFLFTFLHLIMIVGIAISMLLAADFLVKVVGKGVYSPRMKATLFIVILVMPILSGTSSILYRKYYSKHTITYTGPESYRPAVDSFIDTFDFENNLMVNGTQVAIDYYRDIEAEYFSRDAMIKHWGIYNSFIPIGPFGNIYVQNLWVHYMKSENTTIYFQYESLWDTYMCWNIYVNETHAYRYSEWWVDPDYMLQLNQTFTIPSFSGIMVEIGYSFGDDHPFCRIDYFGIFALLNGSGEPIMVLGFMSRCC